MSPLLLVAVVGATSAVAIALLSTTTRRRRTGTVGAADPDAAESWLVRHAPRRSVPLLRTLDRQVAGGAGVAVSFVLVLLVALFLGWILDSVNDQSGFARWDEAAAEWGARNATDLSTVVLERITDLGGTPFLFAAVVLASVVDFARFRNWSVPLHLGAVLGGVVLVSNGVKILVDRDRPDIAQLVGWSGASFPSGHSAAAAAGWAAIAFVLTRRSARPVRVHCSCGRDRRRRDGRDVARPPRSALVDRRPRRARRGLGLVRPGVCRIRRATRTPRCTCRTNRRGRRLHRSTPSGPRWRR